MTSSQSTSMSEASSSSPPPAKHCAASCASPKARRSNASSMDFASSQSDWSYSSEPDSLVKNLLPRRRQRNIITIGASLGLTRIETSHRPARPIVAGNSYRKKNRKAPFAPLVTTTTTTSQKKGAKRHRGTLSATEILAMRDSQRSDEEKNSAMEPPRKVKRKAAPLVSSRKSQQKSTTTRTASATTLPRRDTMSHKSHAGRRQIESTAQPRQGHHQHHHILQPTEESSGSSDSEDEVPYTQNLSAVPQSRKHNLHKQLKALQDDEEQSNTAAAANRRSREPLRPGDIIEYYNPIFRRGDPKGYRTTQVLATARSPRRNDDNACLLELANGEYLPLDTKVKRVAEYSRKAQSLVRHPGVTREIKDFRIRTRRLDNASTSTSSGLQKRVEAIRQFLLKAQEEMQRLPERGPTADDQDDGVDVGHADGGENVSAITSIAKASSDVDDDSSSDDSSLNRHYEESKKFRRSLDVAEGSRGADNEGRSPLDAQRTKSTTASTPKAKRSKPLRNPFSVSETASTLSPTSDGKNANFHNAPSEQKPSASRWLAEFLNEESGNVCLREEKSKHTDKNDQWEMKTPRDNGRSLPADSDDEFLQEPIFRSKRPCDESLVGTIQSSPADSARMVSGGSSIKSNTGVAGAEDAPSSGFTLTRNGSHKSKVVLSTLPQSSLDERRTLHSAFNQGAVKRGTTNFNSEAKKTTATSTEQSNRTARRRYTGSHRVLPILSVFLLIGTVSSFVHFHGASTTHRLFAATRQRRVSFFVAKSDGDLFKGENTTYVWDELLLRLQGDFDNYDQVVEDRKEGLLPREGGGHEHIHCCLVPVTKATRLAAFYFDGDPSAIFRFRFYKLVPNIEKLSVDTVLFTLDPALEAALRQYADPTGWKTIFENHSGNEKIKELKNCDVRWSWRMDPVQHAYAARRVKDHDGIHATMVHGEALVESQLLPGVQILVRDQLSLWKDEFWIHDRGFDPTTMNFIYGNQRGVPYQLKRVTSLRPTNPSAQGSEIAGEMVREIVDDTLSWTLGPAYRTMEEYQAKLSRVGGPSRPQRRTKPGEEEDED